LYRLFIQTVRPQHNLSNSRLLFSQKE